MPVNKASNWAARTKEATSAVAVTNTAKTGGKKDYGRAYSATIDSVAPTVFKTGSFGLKIAYNLEGESRRVFENIILKKLNDDGVLVPTAYGLSSLKHRLTAAGLTADEINQISFPENPKNIGTLPDLAGARVTVFAADTEYMGRPQKEIRLVKPAEAA